MREGEAGGQVPIGAGGRSQAEGVGADPYRSRSERGDPICPTWQAPPPYGPGSFLAGPGRTHLTRQLLKVINGQLVEDALEGALLLLLVGVSRLRLASNVPVARAVEV